MEEHVTAETPVTPGTREVHVHHTDWTTAIITVCVTAGLSALFGAIAWTAVSITRADREYRSDRVTQCEKIETESARALCVVET